MCPNLFSTQKPTSQKGFLIPLAIFIVAGLSVLAISITRLASQSGLSSFREGLSAQALYAADSGVQFAMNQILFLNTARADATTACASVNGGSLNFDVDGLDQCSVDLSCSASTNAADSISYYTVNSFATCGVGELYAERVIQATAYLE